MAVLKHAAAYNIEQPAGTIIVSPRVLQEIYLPAFQTAIEKGGGGGVMCAYSNVNNVPSCQNPAILNTPLYQQAGFTGFVTSDWGAIHSTADSANAGETIEMPFGGFFGAYLIQAVAERAGHPGHLRHHGVPDADPDVPVRHVRQGAERLDQRHRHHVRARAGRAAGRRGGHGPAQEQRRSCR